MGERLSSPSSIVTRVPSRSPGRGGQNFSPTTPSLSEFRGEHSATFNFTKPKIGEVARFSGRFGQLEKKANTTSILAREIEQIPQLPLVRDRANPILNPDARHFTRSSGGGDRHESRIGGALTQAQKRAMEAVPKPQFSFESPGSQDQSASKEKGIVGAKLDGGRQNHRGFSREIVQAWTKPEVARPTTTQQLLQKAEIQAQKPAVLNRDRFQIFQDRAVQTAERIKKYILSIDLKNPMTLLEMAEVARVGIKIAGGGGLGEISAFFASAVLIRGIEAFPLTLTDQTSSSFNSDENPLTVGVVMEFTEKAIEQELRHKTREKIPEKTFEGAREKKE